MPVRTAQISVELILRVPNMWGPHKTLIGTWKNGEIAHCGVWAVDSIWQGASRQSYVSELLGPINYSLQTWHETSTLCELSVSRTLASFSQLPHLEPWLCTWSKMNRVRIEHARPTAPSPGAYVPIKNIKLRSLVRTRRI